jgi:hypothetical protein
MDEKHKALEFTDRPWTVKLHLSMYHAERFSSWTHIRIAHCIETLRQNISKALGSHIHLHC